MARGLRIGYSTQAYNATLEQGLHSLTGQAMSFGAPGGVATDFDALYDPSFALVSDTTYYARPSESKPASKASTITTPTYTCPLNTSDAADE